MLFSYIRRMIKINFDEPIPAPAAEATPSGLDLRVTDEAAHRLQKLITAENKPHLALRISVNGGGCGGYSYAFKFDAQRNPDDIAITHLGVTVLVDPISNGFLKGAVFDYMETIETAQFVIKNPNASSSCGCGNSFSI